MIFLFIVFSLTSVFIQIVCFFLLKKQIERIHKRIDSIFVLDESSPNTVSVDNKDEVDLTEENIMSLVKKDIKFEFESSEQIPYGAKES